MRARETKKITSTSGDDAGDAQPQRGTVKFVHAADLHLDSPLVGLEHYEGAPVERLRGATRAALINLVDFCLEESAGLLVIAGDVYDGDWKDYRTGLFFISQMARLTREGVQVCLVRGNHDAASQVTRSLRLPEGVSELSTRKADTLVLERLGIALHGRSFPEREVRDDLSASYPPPIPGLCNVGMLHTALVGRAGHESYAPCSVERLVAKGYQYWALGHVHRREVVSQAPWIVFPGNLQGRHARETGPKGATLVTLEDGEIVSAVHRDLDAVRWDHVDVDLEANASGDDVAELIHRRVEAEATFAEDRPLAVRVAVAGRTRAHRELVAAPEKWRNEIIAAVAATLPDVWVERVRFATRTPLDLDALAYREDALGGLVRGLRAKGDEAARLREEIADLFAKLRENLPEEYLQGSDALDLADMAALGDLVEEAGELLIPRLLEKEEGA